MAVPTYTTGLTSINTAESATGYTEPTGATAGGIAVAETDFFIQGTGCISKTFNATGLGGLHYNNGSGLTIPSPGAYFAWIYHAAINAVDTEANGGMRLTVGSGVGDYKSWHVRGKDTHPYGGWICVPVDPTVAADVTTGSPTATLQYFGYVANGINAVAKGNPFGFDAIRYGRGDLRVAGGETANYATFLGASTENDTTTNRWGLCQAIPGGYLQQGLFIFGYAALVDFRDSNTSVLIANTKKVISSFNAFEVRNASSNLLLTSISFTALGTVSKGNWITTDNATVALNSCVFTDMDTFGFLSATTATSSIFRRCGLITLGGATFSKCTITNASGAISVSATTLNTMTDCTFESDGSNVAVDLGVVATTQSMNWNNYLTSYAGSNGSTGNEAIKVSVSSGQTLTINVGAGYSTPSVWNIGAGSVSVVSSATLTIKIVDADGVAITATCEVTVVKNSDVSILYNDENVITGTTAYVYSSGAGTVVYINIMNVTGYQPKTVNGYTLASANETVTVQLDSDPFYSNPV